MLTCFLLALVSIIARYGSLAQYPVPAVVNKACPSVAMREEIHQSIQEQVESLLQEKFRNNPPCPCGGPGDWTRIAHLNMSDPTQQCPPNWNLTMIPVRGCGRSSDNAACDSTTFPSNGRSYSRVCGRVNAYQSGSPNAFSPSVQGSFSPGRLEDVYVDGVSLTHGTAGSRQHIWTFAAALYETDPNPLLNTICPCTNTSINWPFEIPSFVGSNYFCATGNPGPGFNQSTIYADNPLWDGEGCGPSNACCELNNPPWFCTTLPQPTTDDVELRICLNQERSNENVIISLVDVFVE